jgi:molybdopterin-containing oxidoreductase family iron-sulfur binding subunit
MDQNAPHTDPTNRLDLEAINAKLRGKQGPSYWRSLEEVAETPEFQNWVADEFPNRRDLAGLDRRDFLKFMGASLALAGLSGCRSVFMPVEKLVPYVHQPEEMTIGKPLYYATAMPLMGYGLGVLVEQREGRPLKLEGNPQHPSSLGSLDSMTQAQILNFYDPDRLTGVLNQGNLSTWEQFQEIYGQAMQAQAAKQGAGLRLLTGTVVSPTLVAQIERLKGLYPQMGWHVWEPLNQDEARAGALKAFGQVVDVRYDLSATKTIVALDSNFLVDRPDSLVLARQFADGRRVLGTSGTMNRLYAIESAVTVTGATADHRWPVRPGDVLSVAQAIGAALGVGSGSTTAIPAAAVAAIAKDLQTNAGASVIVVGANQPAEVHALVHAINDKLGNLGKTVITTMPVEGNPVQNLESISRLADDLNKGLVDTVIVLGANPVHTAPADLKFAEAMAKAKFKVFFGAYDNETSRVADWSLPAAHPLEAWGDTRAVDGTVSLVQPLTYPIHGEDTLSDWEFLSVLLGQRRAGYDIVRDHYLSGLTAMDEKAFRKALHDGVIAGTAVPPVAVKVAAFSSEGGAPAKAGLTLRFEPCPKILDGRFVNNGWLRELPHPITKVTWDNVAMIAPATAKRMNIETGHLLEIAVKGVAVTAPAFIQPGQPEDVITLTLGYGRTAGGSVAATEESRGYDAYLLRRTGGLGFTSDSVEVKNLGGDFRFANVQMHHAMEGRDIVRAGTLAEFLEQAKEVHDKNERRDAHVDGEYGANIFPFKDEDKDKEELPSMYPDDIFDYEGPKWGMTIDLNLCVGCNACVTACQAENNIPVVGKDQVARGREMHWIRIDRYYGKNELQEEHETLADLANPTIVFQPVMCVHCEKAPCEPVCPVAATVHSHEGLNQMVYNRCVGTRYCSDNCPYKVRRFNYLNYTDNQLQFKENERIPLLRMLNNPDVTVRGRGVMEKCSYCVQRISDARIEAKKAGTAILEGAVVTACQQACPTQAITFGDTAKSTSAVYKMRKDPRSYLLLEDLNTHPRTSHMARLRNPNPEITA